jgi:hypothetical protein
VPFAHLPRVLLFGALPGRRRGLPPDRELRHSEAMYLDPSLVRDGFVAVKRTDAARVKYTPMEPI